MNSPLVGREVELARLNDLQQDLASVGEGRFLLVVGEAGVGKTRLINEAVDDELLLLRVSFPRARFAVPGLGIRMLAQLDAPGAGMLREHFERPEEAAGGRLSIWLAANEVLGRSAPCVVVFDDLQWADELTLGWLSQIADVLEGSPVLIVSGVRAVGHTPETVWEAIQAVFRAGRGEEMRLEPFAIEQTARLSGAMGHPTTTAFVTRLHERTDGVPLAVVEMLRELDRHPGRDALSRLRDAAAASDLPLVSAMVRDQLTEVGEDSRVLVEVAALLPQPASEARIRKVLGWDRGAFDAALEPLLGSGLLRAEGRGGWVFRHELQRQGIQDQLPLPESRAHHRKIAAVLSHDSAPSGQVAHHLYEAGALDEAAVLFERAAEEARRVHDHGNALGHLAAALDLVGRADVIVRLADAVVLAARLSGWVGGGLRILDDAMRRTEAEGARGRLLLARARLIAYSGDHEGRMRDLLAAREAFREAPDETGMALALGELALPVGGPMKLRERVALGRQGLELAERSGEPSVIALCAGNLAAAEIMSGERHAFRLWKRAIEVVEPSRPDAPAPEAFRNAVNWVTGALAYGDYPLADRLIRLYLEPVTDPSALLIVEIYRALHAWRTGAWDRALLHAQASMNAHRPEYVALARTIASSIEFEKDARPDVDDLSQSVSTLVELTEEDWGPLAQSILIHIRAERREPVPSRGLSDLIDRVLRTETRVGWDDLLPVAARVDPALCRKLLLLVGDRVPRGPRADAAMAFTRGLLAMPDSAGAESILVEAGERYEALPEPYGQARALEAAAAARLTDGKRAGPLRVRAAEIYSELGAERSLASLLRRAGGSRALAGFRVPANQSHRPSPGLTRREMEVTQLARLGHPARAIAETLGVSTATVQKHLERIKSKLGVARKSDLVRLFSDG